MSDKQKRTVTVGAGVRAVVIDADVIETNLRKFNEQFEQHAAANKAARDMANEAAELHRKNMELNKPLHEAVGRVCAWLDQVEAMVLEAADGDLADESKLLVVAKQLVLDGPAINEIVSGLNNLVTVVEKREERRLTDAAADADVERLEDEVADILFGKVMTGEWGVYLPSPDGRLRSPDSHLPLSQSDLEADFSVGRLEAAEIAGRRRGNDAFADFLGTEVFGEEKQ